MRARILVFLLLSALFLPVCGSAATSGDEAPLTLLHPPHQPQGAGQIGQMGQPPGMAMKTDELRDIYGPVPTAEPLPYLLIAGTILGLLLAGAILYRVLKKRSVAKPAPAIAPWERALLDLAEARSLRSPERGLLYLDRVSQILRSYIESRFAVQSTRQTTREFLEGLTRVGTASPLQTLQIHRAELQGCLELADMAKFAHRLPDLGNLEQMELAITSFIRRTVPAEPAEPGRSSKRARRGRP